MKCINNNLCVLIISEERHQPGKKHFLCLPIVVLEIPLLRLTPLD